MPPSGYPAEVYNTCVIGNVWFALLCFALSFTNGVKTHSMLSTVLSASFCNFGYYLFKKNIHFSKSNRQTHTHTHTHSIDISQWGDIEFFGQLLNAGWPPGKEAHSPFQWQKQEAIGFKAPSNVPNIQPHKHCNNLTVKGEGKHVSVTLHGGLETERQLPQTISVIITLMMSASFYFGCL